MDFFTATSGDLTPAVRWDRAAFIAAGAFIGFVCGSSVGIAYGGTAVKGGAPLAIAGAAAGETLWRHSRRNGSIA
jgi:hypothetical protein